MPNSIRIPLLERGTADGISRDTLDCLMAATGLTASGVAQMALRQLADRMPSYALDDGPLTAKEMTAIKTASPVSRLPAARITRRLL